LTRSSECAARSSIAPTPTASSMFGPTAMTTLGYPD
jgi:hypothetical protein